MAHVGFLFSLPDSIPQAQCLLFISSDNVCAVYLEKNMVVSSLPTFSFGRDFVNSFGEEQSSAYRGHLFVRFSKELIERCPNTILQLLHQKPPRLQAGKMKVTLTLDFCHGWAAHGGSSTDQMYEAVSIWGGIEQLRTYFGKEATEEE